MRKRRGFFAVSFYRLDFIVLGILTLAGLMLVGGVFPKMELTPSQKGEELIPVENLKPVGGERTLQLSPIKFKKCTGTTAIDFLLDRSGSMNNDNKLPQLKKAVLTFTSKLSDDSVIGMQDFSYPLHPSGTVKVLVPFGYYKNLKTVIPNAVNGLIAFGNTHTRDAFIFAQARINEAVPQYPKYKFAMIFISDGVPHTDKGDFDPAQMPNDIAASIKKSGIRIFAIAYGREAQAATSLMKQVASSPSDSFYAPNPEQIDKILSDIATKICDNPQ